MKKFICGLLSAVIFFTGSVCFVSHKTEITGTYDIGYLTVTQSEESYSADETVVSDLSILPQDNAIEHPSGSVPIILLLAFLATGAAASICCLAGVACELASIFVKDK